jgi:hypothetical protein
MLSSLLRYPFLRLAHPARSLRRPWYPRAYQCKAATGDSN